MATKKSDIVRRSLFGTTQAVPDDERPDFSEIRQTRTTRQRNVSARRTLPPVVEPAAEVGLVAPAGRRVVERTAVTVPTNLLMQVKDAVAVLKGWPQQYTMARFVEEAFAAHLERLKVEHNGGRDFPITNRKIRTGRPPGTCRAQPIMVLSTPDKAQRLSGTLGWRALSRRAQVREHSARIREVIDDAN